MGLMASEGRWMLLRKVNVRSPRGDGTLQSLDCGGGYRNLHVRYNCIELNTHKNESKSNWGSLRKIGGLYL